MQTWRYIPPFSAPGTTQMAIDSWLFHQCNEGHQPPTLRFYTWFPVTLSLGYFQKQWPAHWSELTWHGHPLSLVRRPSGGRGVLHQGDLTYSLTCQMQGYTHAKAYKALCEFLIQGWCDLGHPLTFGSAGRGYHRKTNCFQLATSADLVCENGYKFIGSAQLWRGDTVLQHGSMALNPDKDLQALVFGHLNPSRASHLPCFDKQPSFAVVIETLRQAAQDVLKIHLDTTPLSTKEWDEIQSYLPKTIVHPPSTQNSELFLYHSHT